MTIRTLALILGFSALAGSALADDGRAEAKLQNPVAAPTKAIAGELSWSGIGTVCAAFPATESVQSVAACRALVREVGPVASYGLDGKMFTPALLARCNAK